MSAVFSAGFSGQVARKGKLLQRGAQSIRPKDNILITRGKGRKQSGQKYSTEGESLSLVVLLSLSLESLEEAGMGTDGPAAAPLCCWSPAGVSRTGLGLSFNRAHQLVTFSFIAVSDVRTEV